MLPGGVHSVSGPKKPKKPPYAAENTFWGLDRASSSFVEPLCDVGIVRRRPGGMPYPGRKTLPKANSVEQPTSAVNSSVNAVRGIRAIRPGC